jgi:hypothetical protein
MGLERGHFLRKKPLNPDLPARNKKGGELGSPEKGDAAYCERLSEKESGAFLLSLSQEAASPWAPGLIGLLGPNPGTNQQQAPD